MRAARAPVGKEKPPGNAAATTRPTAPRYRLTRPGAIVFALIVLLSALAILAVYFMSRPPVKAPVAARQPVPIATAKWRPIAERMQQAQHGQFPIDEGILTFSKSFEESDAEVRSIIGTYALAGAGAAKIESGEAWGVTGVNRDEFVMYVHNFLTTPLSAMVLRISEGR